MITGRVNWLLEAIVSVEVQDADGHLHQFQCVLDTGFDGDIALPSAVIHRLELAFAGPSDTVFLSGYSAPLPVYEGTASWHGQPIQVAVLETERESVLGMALLENNTLTIQAWDGGEVLIEERR